MLQQLPADYRFRIGGQLAKIGGIFLTLIEVELGNTNEPT